jgi:hypothetical protein
MASDLNSEIPRWFSLIYAMRDPSVGMLDRVRMGKALGQVAPDLIIICGFD